MEKYHAILAQEIIFTLLTIPIMIKAIIISFQLIPLDYTKMAASMSISSSPLLITLVFIIMQISVFLAIASIILLFVNLGLIKETIKNPNTPNIGRWANWTIKFCALLNIFIVWFLDKYNAIQTDIKPALIFWTITFIISIISSIITKIRK